ncbi:MAG TPA: hypothetical protein ACFYD6_05325 [Candidatus Brocadiia bacterium]|nr:hypothetical protein [Candidatus Brocadiales bacterium]
MYIDQDTGIVTTVAITMDTGMDIMITTGHYHIPTSRILTGISHTIITTSTTVPDLITIMCPVPTIVVGDAGHNL